MKHESTDLRVKRTLKCIRQAFNDLILEKNYSQISITELTERADINRKTFYLHYSSLDDLVQEMEEEVAEDLLNYLKTAAAHLDVGECIAEFYQYMNNGSPVLQKLMCDRSYSFFYNNVTDLVLKSTFFKRFYDRTRYPDLVRAYCVGITSVYRSWYENGRTIPLPELSDYAARLLVHGYESVVVR